MMRGAGSRVKPAFQGSAGSTPVVFVLDDDVSIRKSLEVLIRTAGWQAETYDSAFQFLARPRLAVPSCLVLDVALPGVNGLDLQKEVAARRPETPIIFLTGYGDVRMSVRAMKAGAVEFLMKPFSEDVLLPVIANALEASRAMLQHEMRMLELRERYSSLSQRERQVMALVVAGLLNKQVGGQLGISEITVKAHRGNVMRKMRAGSLPDLVKISTKLGIAAHGDESTGAEDGTRPPPHAGLPWP